MNVIYFQPRKRRNVENNNYPLNIRFVAKTSDIRNFSQNIRSGNTGCQAELCPLFHHKDNVWWKRTFLPMTTIVVLHHKHMKVVMSSHLHHMLCVFRQIRFSSVDL